MASKDVDSRIERLKELVKEFPQEPGVYLMKNRVEKIIYVGKAKSLRHRVRSYLSDSKDLTAKTRFLVTHIQSIEYILTKTEVEAFLLEASLIKKHRPKYNIRLKDDRAYPYIRVTMREDFPRLTLSRKVQKDGSHYFGPFTSGFVVHQTIQILNRVFLLRDCSDHFMKSRKRPCMTHQIGRCSAPCVNLVTVEKYGKDVLLAVQFLRGRHKSVVEGLEAKMRVAASLEQFEVAAKYRDGLKAIEAVLEKQTVVNDQSDLDQDVAAFFGDERGTNIELLHIRAGRVVGTRPHFTAQLNAMDPNEDPREWLVSFLNQYYEENVVPDEVILPVPIGDDLTKLLEAVLAERKGSKCRVRLGTESKMLKLSEMAERNAVEHFKTELEKSDKKRQGLEEIKRKFHLEKLPRRIECFDISHFQGKETVASQVVFDDGVPLKEEYRLYRIKTTGGGDDYAAMKEVLGRRLKHLEYEEPDLILVDGGKGQLRMAMEVLKELGRSDIPLASLAKARTEGDFVDKEVVGSEERFFLPNRANPVIFPTHSEAFRILVSARNEAHRFAINYYRKLRENSSLESALDLVPGLGPARKKLLMEQFESVEAIKGSEAKDIAALKGFSLKLADEILSHLRGDSSAAES